MALKDPQSETMKAPKVVADERPKKEANRNKPAPSEALPDPDLGAPEPELEEGMGSVDIDDDYDDGFDKTEEQEDESKLHRVEMLTHDAIVNGHKLAHGHVIEMSMHDVRKHRRQGVAISDPLSDDDKREVSVDVTKPFQPEQTDGPDA